MRSLRCTKGSATAAARAPRRAWTTRPAEESLAKAPRTIEDATHQAFRAHPAGCPSAHHGGHATTSAHSTAQAKAKASSGGTTDGSEDGGQGVACQSVTSWYICMYVCCNLPGADAKIEARNGGTAAAAGRRESEGRWVFGRRGRQAGQRAYHRAPRSLDVSK
ncbi:hypothetical protein BC834DRAFT_108175 [Gloeopeniophorella convolvens]|nr:hypothetical protein BC834DRAFT_108175 [Gloeopeniophorella convolvens]